MVSRFPAPVVEQRKNVTAPAIFESENKATRNQWVATLGWHDPTASTAMANSIGSFSLRKNGLNVSTIKEHLFVQRPPGSWVRPTGLIQPSPRFSSKLSALLWRGPLQVRNCGQD